MRNKIIAKNKNQGYDTPHGRFKKTGLPELISKEKQPQELQNPRSDQDCKLYDRVDVYLHHLNQMVLQKERTPSTYLTYQNSLQRFYEWGKERGFPPVDPNLIRRYKECLIAQNLLPATVNLYLVALRVFFEYYFNKKWIPYNPVRAEVYNALMDYLTVRGFSKPEDPLFAKLVLPTKSDRPKSLTTRALEQIVTKYMLKAGIKTQNNPRPEITLHSLRHTTANLALDGGAPIVNVQEMMRHEDITTTMIYVKQWNRVKQAAELHIKQI